MRLQNVPKQDVSMYVATGKLKNLIFLIRSFFTVAVLLSAIFLHMATTTVFK